MKIYAGNLSFNMTDDSLGELFRAYGTVDESIIIIDRDSGRSKGFGFVQMPDRNEAEKAVKELNGKEIDGRAIRVDIAKEREERPRRLA